MKREDSTSDIFEDKAAKINENELEVINRFITTGGMVFDIGANLGQWTMRVLKRKVNCNYHLFEPSIDLFRKLSFNLFYEIEKGKIVVNNYAISNCEATKLFYYYSKFPGNSTFYRRGSKVEGPPFNIGKPEIEEISSISLDKYCKEKGISLIDFLKIDTEGSEWEILKGARNLISNGRIDFIQFEYGECFRDAGSTLREVYKYLVNYKYEIFKMLPDRLKYVRRFISFREDYKWCNFLAVNKRLRRG